MGNNLSDLRGHWAIVTGASSGIGRCFAEAIAKAGLNLVIIGRSHELLAAVAERIRDRHGVLVEVLELDLVEANAIDRLLSMVNRLGIRVAMRVNSAGFGYWGEYEKASEGLYRGMITLNVYIPMALAVAFDKHLFQAPQGIMINVSSAAVLQPVPYMAAYAASKAALQQFGLALHEEWRQRGVLVQTLVAGPTDTGFDTKSGLPADKVPSLRGSPDELVRRSLDALSDGCPLVYGPGVGYGQRLFGSFAPMSLVLKVVGRMFKP